MKLILNCQENYLLNKEFRVECRRLNQLFCEWVKYVGFDDHTLGCRELENESNAGECQTTYK